MKNNYSEVKKTIEEMNHREAEAALIIQKTYAMLKTRRWYKKQKKAAQDKAKYESQV
jgi:hypothetical protein